jgi:hypothetical protein
VNLPTEQQIKDTLWRYAHSDLTTDVIQDLYAQALDFNTVESEEEQDELYEAVSERFYEVMT